MFAVAAGLLTLAFRRNRAKVRYWLWLSASFKFLVPFSLLMGLGSHLEWAPAAQKMRADCDAGRLIRHGAYRRSHFRIRCRFASTAPDAVDWTALAILGVWACGFAAIALIRFRGWLRIRAAVRASTPLAIPAAVEVRSSPGLLEPGVVGLLRPILLAGRHPGTPDAASTGGGAGARAVPCPPARQLSASIHMVVEAVFWFHPLVWWIGARLVEERERACDEERAWPRQ